MMDRTDVRSEFPLGRKGAMGTCVMKDTLKPTAGLSGHRNEEILKPCKVLKGH